MIFAPRDRTVFDQRPELLAELISKFGVGWNRIVVGGKKLSEVAVVQLGNGFFGEELRCGQSVPAECSFWSQDLVAYRRCLCSRSEPIENPLPDLLSCHATSHVLHTAHAHASHFDQSRNAGLVVI